MTVSEIRITRNGCIRLLRQVAVQSPIREPHDRGQTIEMNEQTTDCSHQPQRAAEELVLFISS
jgi:hypothetical protein